jgi:hypothetical protein
MQLRLLMMGCNVKVILYSNIASYARAGTPIVLNSFNPFFGGECVFIFFVKGVGMS